jgi:hypothetical protein
MALSAPECPYGYPISQLEGQLSSEEFQSLGQWLRGQTMMLCTGEKYDHENQQTIASECAENPHGAVVYKWDVDRYFAGLPVID